MPVRKIERALELLSALRSSEANDGAVRELRRALSEKVNVIVAKAAALAGQMQIRVLTPDLCTAFDRLLIDPGKNDPQCWGKDAIAKALRDLGHADSDVFLRGAKHVQMEPVWGGVEDTATGLRATCALALLQCTDLTREEKLWPIMRLLTEKSPSLRKDAATALESLEGREAALLLRIKARMGDLDATVTGQVFESLLRVEGEGAVAFVVEFLRDTNNETREEAALALGSSRLTGAVAALKDTLEQKPAPVNCEIVFRSLSLSRHEVALQFLVDAVRKRRRDEAMAALEALKLHRGSSDILSRVSEALAGRNESELRREFEGWSEE